LREAQSGDEDIASVVGPATGRHEPTDGLDHSWQTSVRLAKGEDVQKADSYRSVRRNGPLGGEQNKFKEGPWSAPPNAPIRKDASARQLRETVPSLKSSLLKCSKIEDGILKITGLPFDVQSDLLRAVFPPGARGVCGGLYDARRGTIEVGRKDWSVTNGSQVTWSQLGLHGSHTVQMENLQGSVVELVWNAIKEASPSELLESFHPDSVRVAFESMHGRTIRPGSGQTLCGWSRDNDRVDNKDRSPKVLILGGSAKISKGFKYSKENQESLDVDLSPGDVLVLYGPARTWVSAVNGFEPSKAHASKAPFDFVHIWLHDHRHLQKVIPGVYKSIHHPPTPVKGGNEYKWMQYAYTVSDKRNSDGELIVELSDGGSVTRENAGSKLTALERSGNHAEYLIPGLFVLASIMLASIGLRKKFRSFQKPVQGLQDSLIHI
jgi:hypothetical protein